jgi:hypothetical protein
MSAWEVAARRAHVYDNGHCYYHVVVLHELIYLIPTYLLSLLRDFGYFFGRTLFKPEPDLNPG